MPRYAAKVDRNHTEIVRGLRDAGVRVWDTSRLGSGYPDACCYWPATGLHLIEIKMPGEKLTEHEAKFHALFEGAAVHIVFGVEDALRKIGAI